jgi:tetratricopeptide (TPR) repeat protein
VADTLRAETLLDRAIARTNGVNVVKLARAVCLAVLVEPGLLRRARMHLVPGANADTESDLWFSLLVLTRNATGIVLDPDVVTVLRQQLVTGADDPEFAGRARDLVAQLHAGHPPAVQLEEEVVWEAVRYGSAARSQLEAQLRTAVKAMATDSDGGRDVARWAAQAWWRLPEAAIQTDAAHLLVVGAALRLGTAGSVARFGEQKMPASLGWLMPRGSGAPILLGVELAADGLRFVEPTTDGLVFELPRTSPLVVEIGWYDGATSHSEVMAIAPGTDMVLGSVVGQVTLRTLAGQRYIIEPEVVDGPSQAGETNWTTSEPRVVNPPPMTAPSWFQDRHVETQLIGEWLRDDDLRLLMVVGRGGVGKTAMVCRLLKALEAGRLLDDGGELPVDAIVYLSPNGIHPVSFPNLFADLTRLLPDAAAQRLLQLYRDSQQPPGQLMRALLEAFPSGRSIVLLDNLEDVIDPATLAVRDAELDAALSELLAAPAHGIKVIATSRLVPRELLLRQPGRSKRLDLDEGLPVPEAIEVLRAMDADGALGLRDASPELLAAACERTRGFPRALEALAAVLAADRETSLPELLARTQAVLPDQIVEVLAREGFNRLDPLAQQVMQALAIYAVPVSPVAVDYLLEPFQPAIDSGSVLSRLVNMHFARRDAGRYYLHQVDRDFALGRIPPGQPDDLGAGPGPFTRYALQVRAAGYFEQTRTPRDSWRTLDDLAPQLAEFELRCANADYDTAAAVLADIDFDYLQRWGHYRLAADMHERLLGRLTDPYWQMYTVGALGTIYSILGQSERAIDLYQQALAIARETGDRSSEGQWLGGLGDVYVTLGQSERAIDLYQQALAIARDTGSRGQEAVVLGGLGDVYVTLGQIEQAIDLYQHALGIAREIGNPQGEANYLGNLGVCYADLGEPRQAIDFYQQAIQVADQIGFVPTQSEARSGLATVYLFQDDLLEAREVAEAARAYDYPTNNANISAILGVVLLRQRETEQARQAFADALAQANGALSQTSNNYAVLDSKVLALCGLALLGETHRLPEAISAARAARAISQDAGVIRRIVKLLDALGAIDQAGALDAVRAAAAGVNVIRPI